MCWKEKIQWQSVTNGLRKEHVLRPPFLDKVQMYYIIFFSYGYHISMFHGYQILFSIRNPYINRFPNHFSIHS
jgi:hypothetical protein